MYVHCKHRVSSGSVGIETCMTPEDLPSLLSASLAEPSGRGAQCPDEHQIAAYVDGTVATAFSKAACITPMARAAVWIRPPANPAMVK